MKWICRQNLATAFNTRETYFSPRSSACCRCAAFAAAADPVLTCVIIVYESLTQSHDHLPQVISVTAAGRQQGMIAGPLGIPSVRATSRLRILEGGAMSCRPQPHFTNFTARAADITTQWISPNRNAARRRSRRPAAHAAAPGAIPAGASGTGVHTRD